MGLLDDGEGIEPETITDEESIKKPFDPTQIRIETKKMTMDLLLKRLELNEIDLQPGFQRKSGIWTEAAQSRLIESLLVKIPIPAFYMDASDNSRWLIIDGLQRLTALKRFMIKKDLKLTGLEFLTQFHGNGWDDLSRYFQRGILETELTIFNIEKGTPPDVKFNIFKRINTGGLPLSPQEIRHALNQGESTILLSNLASTKAFLNATGYGVRSNRMVDREFVLRFLAFSITSWEKYTIQDLDSFLNDSMDKINGMTQSELNDLSNRFESTMITAYNIFGRHTFRKYYGKEYVRHPINKALFEAWSINIDRLSGDEKALLEKRKSKVLSCFKSLLDTDDSFVGSISQSTGNIKRIKIRFSTIAQLIRRVLDD
ncbi:MAG: DUF262 domain-containing protein [Calditrichaeota bacterium]|nr:DUF262 domain-containing protein [Calditrichota bacterium]